ncbi:MAG: TonB family protein [Acidobacteriaceae bacterium]
MSTFETWLLSYLLNSLWQVPLLFAAGYLAARALRPTGPAAEHRVWVSVLALQAVLPALSTLPRSWLRIPLPWTHTASLTNGAHVSIIMGAGTTPSAFHLPATFLATITVTYIATSTYFAGRFLWRCRSLRVLTRDAAHITLTNEAAACWSRCEQRFGIKIASVAASPRISGPVTIGFAQKIVLLPVSMVSTLPESDLHTIITHEFAHMRRNDFAKNILYELLSLPISYHPLAWFTRERITESREILCDQMASELGSRTQYARSLLRLASLLVAGIPARSPHAIGIFDTRKFERRIMKLTEKQSKIPTLRRLALLTACIAFALATCGSALALSTSVIPSASTASSSKKAAPLTVSPGIMAGQRIGGDDPKYPAEAKKDKVQGTVILDAIIGKDGTIHKLHVISGPKELRKSAADAVRTWKYKPYLLNGNPVEVETKINVVYTLAG